MLAIYIGTAFVIFPLQLISISATYNALLPMQGIVAVAGALSRNLAYLEDEHRGSFLSIYDNPSVVLKVICFHGSTLFQFSICFLFAVWFKSAI